MALAVCVIVAEVEESEDGSNIALVLPSRPRVVVGVGVAVDTGDACDDLVPLELLCIDGVWEEDFGDKEEFFNSPPWLF